MKYKKITERNSELLLVYFVDQFGRKQGTLCAYSVHEENLIREDKLVYQEEYKDGLVISSERVTIN
jgi:hypothetical protein